MTHSVSGPIPPKYSIYCNLIDKTGAIATVATILSNSNISIKNIGIVHNREQFEGALNIQFYDNMDILSFFNNSSFLIKKVSYPFMKDSLLFYVLYY